MERTLILGLGNPILSDDGVGSRIARVLADRFNRPEMVVRESSLSGLSLLDEMANFDKAVIIDAIQTVNGKAGRIYRLDMEDLAFTRHAASPHDVNLATALELGRRLGLSLPRQITIFAIEVENVTTFGEECTPEVERAIPECVEMIIHELNGDSCIIEVEDAQIASETGQSREKC